MYEEELDVNRLDYYQVSTAVFFFCFLLDLLLSLFEVKRRSFYETVACTVDVINVLGPVLKEVGDPR